MAPPLRKGQARPPFPPVPAWSFRSAAVLCLAVLAARPAASLGEALALAAAALAVAALAVRPTDHPRTA